jgi:adenylate cyclase
MRERERFQEALTLYRAQRWGDAEAAMRRLNEELHGAKLYSSFLERIAYLRAHPPGNNWNGAFTFTAK